jgi:hypothetical protein
MELNLQSASREDERFHLQSPEPTPKVWGWRWLLRRTTWENLVLPDGSAGLFTSWVLFNRIQFYHGTTKCDGTRTVWYRTGVLGDPHDTTSFVMTTTPKEMLAFRHISQGFQAVPTWDNMGGS